MVALFSDTHSNLAALVAALRQKEQLGAATTYCLGDTVGYGPNPRECLRLIRQHTVLSTLGNHDQAIATSEWSAFNPVAARAAAWTRLQLESAPDGDELLAYLRSSPRTLQMPDVRLVHASPRDPVGEYIFEQDVWNSSHMAALFGSFTEPWCFIGHTHKPGVFLQGNNGAFTYQPSLCFPNGFVLPRASRAIVNVGSVGQPRDGDPRACFATFDGETVRGHRVPYSIANTQRRMRRHSDAFDQFLIGRLEHGI